MSFSGTTRPACCSTSSTKAGSPSICAAEIVVPYKSPFSAASSRSAAGCAAPAREPSERGPGGTGHRQARGEEAAALHRTAAGIIARHRANPYPIGDLSAAAAGGGRRRAGRATVEPLEIGPRRHVRLAAWCHLADSLPIAARTCPVAPKAADIAAFEQSRRRVRRLGQRLLDIGERRVEPFERTVGRGAVNKRVDPSRGWPSTPDRDRRRPCRDSPRTPPPPRGRPACRGRSASAPPPGRRPHRREPGRRRGARPAPPGRAPRRAAPPAPCPSPAPGFRGGSPPPDISPARSARRRRNGRPDARRPAHATPVPGVCASPGFCLASVMQCS